MIVYLVALLVALVYLSAIPIRVGIALDTTRKPWMRVTLGIGRIYLDYDGGLTRTPDLGLVFELKRRGAKKPHQSALSTLWRQGQAAVELVRPTQYLLSHIKLTDISLFCRVGAQDAAQTALMYGGVLTLIQSACAFFKIHPHTRVTADFQKPQFLLAATGILQFKSGHIMLTALWSAFEIGYGRVRKWIGIQSKAS